MRFTIAHEIGHCVLGHQRKGDFIDEPGNFFIPTTSCIGKETPQNRQS
jgi:Zn-dependent peptidase ImmA (M78 family)